MSTTPTPQPSGGILGGLSNTIIQAVTGTDVNALQQQAQQAEQYIAAAVGAIIVLELIIALELLVLTAMQWKERH